MSELKSEALEDYEWREYEWCDPKAEYGIRIYRISKPVRLYWRDGGSTHRILEDNGVVHIVPAPPVSVIRYKKVDGAEPVKF